MNKKYFVLLFYILISFNCFSQSENTINRLGGPPSQRQNQNESNLNNNSGSNSNSNNTSGSNNKQYSVPQYNPSVDNHLAAPKEKETSGLFGYSVFEVEEILRNLGARNYSYTFGKNSRMVLSKYMIVLNFDKNKRLGSINVKAIAPYKHVPPIAKEYFMKLFLGNSDLASYSVKLSSTELEISYKK